MSDPLGLISVQECWTVCSGYTCPSSVVKRANPVTYVDTGDAGVAFLPVHVNAGASIAWQQRQILYDALTANGISAKLDILPDTPLRRCDQGADQHISFRSGSGIFGGNVSP